MPQVLSNELTELAYRVSLRKIISTFKPELKKQEVALKSNHAMKNGDDFETRARYEVAEAHYQGMLKLLKDLEGMLNATNGDETSSKEGTNKE